MAREYYDEDPVDIDEISAALDEMDERCETIDEYLDRVDQDRMEWERVENDLFPAVDPDNNGLRPSKVHKDTDPIQGWLQQERARRATENALDD